LLHANHQSGDVPYTVAGKWRLPFLKKNGERTKNVEERMLGSLRKIGLAAAAAIAIAATTFVVADVFG
jgi:hypothetical protein